MQQHRNSTAGVQQQAAASHAHQLATTKRISVGAQQPQSGCHSAAGVLPETAASAPAAALLLATGDLQMRQRASHGGNRAYLLTHTHAHRSASRGSSPLVSHAAVVHHLLFTELHHLCPTAGAAAGWLLSMLALLR